VRQFQLGGQVAPASMRLYSVSLQELAAIAFDTLGEQPVEKLK
jgi:hypothetical protein